MLNVQSLCVLQILMQPSQYEKVVQSYKTGVLSKFSILTLHFSYFLYFRNFYGHGRTRHFAKRRVFINFGTFRTFPPTFATFLARARVYCKVPDKDMIRVNMKIDCWFPHLGIWYSSLLQHSTSEFWYFSSTYQSSSSRLTAWKCMLL
jgi:hypothetical protein